MANMYQSTALVIVVVSHSECPKDAVSIATCQNFLDTNIQAYALDAIRTIRWRKTSWKISRSGKCSLKFSIRHWPWRILMLKWYTSFKKYYKFRNHQSKKLKILPVRTYLKLFIFTQPSRDNGPCDSCADNNKVVFRFQFLNRVHSLTGRGDVAPTLEVALYEDHEQSHTTAYWRLGYRYSAIW